MLRHARSRRSGCAPGRSITTPQHSDGYSASAWAWIRAYSSGVRIIVSESAPGKGRPAPREGWPAPREGWNDRDLVAILQRRLKPLKRLDALIVHVDVDVVVDVTRLVAHEALEGAESSLELVEQPADVARNDGHAVRVVRGAPKRRRDIDVDAHALLLAFLERHAEVALASIAHHRHDDPVRRQRFGDAAGCPHVGAGRDADQQPLLPRQAPGRRGGILVTNEDDLVEDGAVEHARHKGGADALDAVGPRPAAREHGRARGLDADHADPRHPLLEHLAHSRDRAAG